ncbi:MAG TPA: ADP-forming succinate--CoA ligase subunit beta [Candidatus Marinimicrobia bacterium]|jgi:succinyl-CoA synthetase beta subunit|nr:ADP-forming succinate--CoA ligase subunit beta [Candidatus Neomarinimicrobiota bacterium]HJM84213.1 ADP-forming succinate--CoA ligase subunit beta [Candidatus Neomarinimicrobiota bacterium]
MKIHEYQGKELFRNAGIPVPNGFPAFSVEEAVEVYKKLETNKVVVKAQIHAGGRGKGGGVKLAIGSEEVQKYADDIFGMNLITHQTGPDGKCVQRLLIEEASDIARELYAGIVLDRSSGKFVFMVSSEGGVEIEKVATGSPERIMKEWIEPNKDLRPFQARKLAFALGLSGVQIKHAVKTFLSLWKFFKSYDCSLMEINPLVVTNSDEIIALDSKINFDDNALYRHKNIQEMRDLSEEEPSEVEADSFNLNYIKLDGNVGCMVNGAGLAMGTMDIIKLYGGEPANFLDVGGIANAETVAHGFKIILSDPNVKSILINIFGGIVRCDRVAQGVIDALAHMEVTIPVVIRLEGTNAIEARNLLKDAEHNFIVANSLADAAAKAVKATGEKI